MGLASNSKLMFHFINMLYAHVFLHQIITSLHSQLLPHSHKVAVAFVGVIMSMISKMPRIVMNVK